MVTGNGYEHRVAGTGERGLTLPRLKALLEARRHRRARELGEMARFVNAAMWSGKEIPKLEKAAAQGSKRPESAEGSLPPAEELPGAPAPASVDESDVFVKGGDPEWDAEQRAAWAL